MAGNYPTPPPSPQNRPVQQARPAVRPAPRIKVGKRDSEDLEARGPTKRPTVSNLSVFTSRIGINLFVPATRMRGCVHTRRLPGPGLESMCLPMCRWQLPHATTEPSEQTSAAGKTSSSAGSTHQSRKARLGGPRGSRSDQAPYSTQPRSLLLIDIAYRSFDSSNKNVRLRALSPASKDKRGANACHSVLLVTTPRHHPALRTGPCNRQGQQCDPLRELKLESGTWRTLNPAAPRSVLQ